MHLKVRVDARGAIPNDLADELAGVLHDEERVAVFCGTVVDKAAFYGLLSRLRRAGLTILDVDVQPDAAGPDLPGLSETDSVASFVLRGRVGPEVRAFLDGAEVLEGATTTTLTVNLRSPDDLFDVLDRLDALNLDLCHVRVRPDENEDAPG